MRPKIATASCPSHTSNHSYPPKQLTLSPGAGPNSFGASPFARPFSPYAMLAVNGMNVAAGAAGMGMQGMNRSVHLENIHQETTTEDSCNAIRGGMLQGEIRWGKNSRPLPPSLALAVHSGATRNVYMRNIEDFELSGEEKLKRDFGEYGEIQLVNSSRNCTFVNFTNISNAIKAIKGVKNKPDCAILRIAHGKDRCANPQRSGS
ncbi:hypothetical protein ID866_8145 [Astraeus odoratus]|nr:hypothetical protein ID866_8145 [Astraeus odoratus]